MLVTPGETGRVIGIAIFSGGVSVPTVDAGDVSSLLVPLRGSCPFAPGSMNGSIPAETRAGVRIRIRQRSGQIPTSWKNTLTYVSIDVYLLLGVDNDVIDVGNEMSTVSLTLLT
jgi:hypothetical protein